MADATQGQLGEAIMTPAQWPIVSQDAETQGFYESMRAAGESHSIAEMLAFRQCPMSNTDREFMEGRGGCYDQFKGQQEVGDYYAGIAKDAGISVGGRVYLSGLAAFPGDPRAWVDGRGDVKRLCEERGWNCEGSVNVKGRPRQDVWGKYEVAQDLVQARAEDLLAAGACGNQEEATEKAHHQLSPVRD